MVRIILATYRFLGDSLKDLLNEIVLCLIDFFTGVTRAVIRLAVWLERVNDREDGALTQLLLALIFVVVALVVVRAVGV